MQAKSSASGTWRVHLRDARAFAATLILCLLIQATLAQAYHIPSGSMENTLFAGDVVVADRVTFGTQFPDRTPILGWKLPSVRVPGLRAPRPGELVIFESPQDAEVDLIKRFVAVAGQTVEVRNKVLYVDGDAAARPEGEKHVDPVTYSRYRAPRDNFGPYVVPDGHFFAMGDNRDLSYDSRFFGPVPLSTIKARPLCVVFSYDPGAPLWNLADKVRWRRIGPFD